jgi:hypothetical protein
MPTSIGKTQIKFVMAPFEVTLMKLSSINLIVNPSTDLVKLKDTGQAVRSAHCITDCYLLVNVHANQ